MSYFTSPTTNEPQGEIVPTEENIRVRIRQHFIELMDEQLADAIMESMPPIPWTDLATKDDIARLDSRFDSVDSRFQTMDARFDSIDSRFETMKTRFNALGTELHSEISAMEGRLSMQFMETTRMVIFAVMMLMTAVLGVAIAVITTT